MRSYSRFGGKYSDRVITLVLGLVLSAPMLGQVPPVGRLGPEIAEVVQKHTKISYFRANQSSSLSSGLYKLVIGQILLDPNERRFIPASDMAILDALPGHTDSSFLRQEQTDLTALCRNSRNRSTSLDVVDLARELDDSRNRRESRLVLHYEHALSQLSSETSTYIQSKLESAAENLQSTEVRLDMVELALERPDIGEVLILDGCDRFEASMASDVVRDIKLKDEFMQAVQPPVQDSGLLRP